MNKKTIHTHGKKVTGMPFMGELMICSLCGKREKSDPKKESQWTALSVEGQLFYICPECWHQNTGVKLR